MAVASDGSLLISASHALGIDDANELLASIPKGATVFVGVVVPRRRLRAVLRQIDDAVAEIAGTTRLSEIGFAGDVSEDARSSGDPHSKRQGRRERPARRR